MAKRCNKCKVEKDLDQFPRRNANPGGYDTLCAGCRNIVNKNYRDRNKGKVGAARKAYYLKNIEKKRDLAKKYYSNNKRNKKEYDKAYRVTNAQKIASYKKDWECKKANDPKFKIKRNLRRRLIHVIERQNKSESVMDLLGCSVDFFIKHIEGQFIEGISWHNYGKYGWHIDHIIPCYKFDLTKIEEQRKCFHYTNLRPLWWKENISRPRD